jgi:monothiol glutaredoxin
MEPDPALRQRIDALVASHPVVLFMKGQRGAPQCGFSATVCGLLDRLIPEYQTVDVLADPALRDGIKAYSSWPTIPQLYVAGEFIGGCDIVQEMAADGSLPKALSLEPPGGSPPEIAISPVAAAALGKMAAEQERPLHLSIDARFQNGLFFGPAEPDDLVLELGELTLHLDAWTATRANGMRIDAVESDEGTAFHLDNPNAPSAVGTMSVTELSERLANGDALHLFDVRPPEERALAHIPGSRLLDEESVASMGALGPDALLVFHCHHGARSAAAAEHFAGQGFRNVWNVAGGIDAWSQEVDPSVPRY